MSKKNVDEALRICEELYLSPLPSGRERWVVGIGGIPASGKTTVAAALARSITELSGLACVAVSMDGFHLARSSLDAMDDPAEAHRRRGVHWTFDLPAFAAFIAALRTEDRVLAPSFDHARGDPVQADIEVGPDAAIVLVEGLYCLLSAPSDWARLVRDQFDARIFVECSIETAAQRIVARHVATGVAAGELSFIYRYILRESCSQFDSLPLTSLTISDTGVAADAASAQLRWESSDLLNAQHVHASLDRATVDAVVCNDDPVATPG